jgi:predicted secreted protein
VNPYSPEQIRELCRERNIQWLIVKQDLQDEEDAVDQEKDRITAALEEDFEQVESLTNYDIYKRIDPNASKDSDDDSDDDDKP